MNLSINQIFSNVQYGIAYGYPECCIINFHVKQVDGRLNKINKDLPTLPGYGFISCIKCHEQKHHFQLHLEIANNRKMPFPFNKGRSDNVSEKEVDDLFSESEMKDIVSFSRFIESLLLNFDAM
jgi:hypothetical protein